MKDYSELIKKLRDLHRDPRPASAEWLFENQVALYDAAAAIEALKAEQKKTVTQIFGEEHQEWEEYCTGLMNRIRELKAQLPKRGEWLHGREIGKEWIYGHWVTYYEDWHCSNCKVVFEQEEKPKYNFCPNCGAKMEAQE